MLRVHQVWSQQRTMRVPLEAAHKHQHVLAVVDAGGSASGGLRGLFDAGALVFRAKEEAQVCVCVYVCGGRGVEVGGI